MAKQARGAPCAPGDMVRIPYEEGDPQAAVYGRVVNCDRADVPRKRWRGLYIKVIDRNVQPGDSLGDAASSPVLLGPFLTTYDALESGRWTILGNVPPAPAEQVLPYFMGSRGIENYWYEPVPDTPENQARMAPTRMFPPDMVVNAIRAKRGVGAWVPLYDRMLPGAT